MLLQGQPVVVGLAGFAGSAALLFGRIVTSLLQALPFETVLLRDLAALRPVALEYYRFEVFEP
jgi:hypothetical protein